MSRHDAWMPLYVGDYLADTARLTTAQHGAYLLLLMDYWRNGSLPDDDAVLAQVTKCSPQEWRKIRPALVGMFQLVDGKWTHKRVEQELADSRKRSEKAEERARHAAKLRWGSDAPSNAPRNAPSMPQAMPGAKQSPSPISTYKGLSYPQDEHKALAAKLGLDVDDQFQRYRDWMASTGKVHKDQNAGFRNWLRNANGMGPAKPIASVVRQNDWQRDENAAQAKAKEVGISARPGESMEAFVLRLRQAVEERARV